MKTKVLDLGEPKALLSLVIDPPRLDNILTSITTLKEVGALFTGVKGKPTPFDGDLSYLGRIMSKLPMDVHLSKLIMLGYVFNVLEECIIMACGLASKNIFTAPYQKRLQAYQVKMTWSEASFSDPMTILNAYQTWKQLHRSEYFKRSGESEKAREKRWARDFNIQLRAIKVTISYLLTFYLTWLTNKRGVYLLFNIGYGFDGGRNHTSVEQRWY